MKLSGCTGQPGTCTSSFAAYLVLNGIFDCPTGTRMEWNTGKRPADIRLILHINARRKVTAEYVCHTWRNRNGIEVSE